MARRLDLVDDDAARPGHDAVAEVAQSDRRGDLLRDLHRAQVGLVQGPVTDPGRHEQPRRHDGRPIVEPGEQRLQLRRPPLEDVDEIDPSRPLRIVSALHAHERRDRVCAVRQQDVVAGRDEVQHAERDDREADDHPGGDR